jgi:hypothetical protein
MENHLLFFSLPVSSGPNSDGWAQYKDGKSKAITEWFFLIFWRFLLLYSSTLSLVENRLFDFSSHFQGRHSHIQLPHGHLLRRHSRLQQRRGYLPIHSGDLAAKRLAAVFAADFKVATRSSSDEFHVLAGTPGLTNNPGQHRQSNLKSPQITCYCNIFIQLYRAIAVLATCHRTQGYRKMPLFHTKRRSGRDRATCLAGSVSRRSDIHYASMIIVFCKHVFYY